jgi:hypothetical protein
MKTALTDRAVKAARPAAKSYDMYAAVVPGMALRVLLSGVKASCWSPASGSSNPTGAASASMASFAGGGARQGPAMARARRPRHRSSRRGRTPTTQSRSESGRLPSRPWSRTTSASKSTPRRREATEASDCRQDRYRPLRGTLVPLFGHRPITELTATEILKPIELIGQIGRRALLSSSAQGIGSPRP